MQSSERTHLLNVESERLLQEAKRAQQLLWAERAKHEAEEFEYAEKNLPALEEEHEFATRIGTRLKIAGTVASLLLCIGVYAVYQTDLTTVPTVVWFLVGVVIVSVWVTYSMCARGRITYPGLEYLVCFPFLPMIGAWCHSIFIKRDLDHARDILNRVVV